MMEQVQPAMASSPSETVPIELAYARSLTKEEQNRSVKLGDLVSALAKAQGAFPDIPRNRTVTVQPRGGGPAYHFKYATLSAIIDAVRKPLADNGLVYTQIISHDAAGGFYVLTTTLYYGEQFLSSRVPLIAEGGSNQQFGSALTYMKRYALAAMLGISADEDDDGNAADGNEVKAISDRMPKAPAPDPITSGKQPAAKPASAPVNGTVIGPKLDTKADNLEALVGKNDPAFSPAKIDVPLLPDESGSDWMKWGKSFIEQARSAPDRASLDALEVANEVPLKNMEISAPKMFTNMKLAMVKVRKDKA